MKGRKKTNEEYIAELAIKNPNVEIIDKYINHETPIYHKCKICGWEWFLRPSNALKGKGCPICSHPPQLIGPSPEYKNSIWASEYKNLAKYYGFSDEQMKTIMPKSNKKIEVQCPNCGYLKLISPVDLFTQGFGCNRCSDGISYPEKFFISILIQLNINYRTHHSFKWSNKRQYDFYLPDYNCIIETHGEQHYKYIGRGRSLEEEKKNDILKESLAKENSIKYYFQIDCSKSELAYIQKNIMQTDIPNVLNFTKDNIDWNQCNIDALSSRVKYVADLWNKGYAVKDISNKVNVDRHSVRRWLNKAKEAQLCNYSLQESWNRGHDNDWRNNILFSSKQKRKQIICVETGKSFISQSDAAKEMNIPQGNIGRSVRSNGKYAADGYHFVMESN